MQVRENEIQHTHHAFQVSFIKISPNQHPCTVRPFCTLHLAPLSHPEHRNTRHGLDTSALYLATSSHLISRMSNNPTVTPHPPAPNRYQHLLPPRAFTPPHPNPHHRPSAPRDRQQDCHLRAPRSELIVAPRAPPQVAVLAFRIGSGGGVSFARRADLADCRLRGSLERLGF